MNPIDKYHAAAEHLLSEATLARDGGGLGEAPEAPSTATLLGGVVLGAIVVLGTGAIFFAGLRRAR